MVVPEPLVMRDPVPHRTEPRGDEAIAPLSAMPLLRHETGIKQNAEVLGDGWAAHLEMSRKRVDGAGGLDEEVEHPAPCRMADCCEDVGLAIGSHHHAANIRMRLLTCQTELSFAKGIGRVGPTLRPQPVAAWHRAAWIVAGSP